MALFNVKSSQIIHITVLIKKVVQLESVIPKEFGLRKMIQSSNLKLFIQNEGAGNLGNAKCMA